MKGKIRGQSSSISEVTVLGTVSETFYEEGAVRPATNSSASYMISKTTEYETVDVTEYGKEPSHEVLSSKASESGTVATTDYEKAPEPAEVLQTLTDRNSLKMAVTMGGKTECNLNSSSMRGASVDNLNTENMFTEKCNEPGKNRTFNTW